MIDFDWGGVQQLCGGDPRARLRAGSRHGRAQHHAELRYVTESARAHIYPPGRRYRYCHHTAQSAWRRAHALRHLRIPDRIARPLFLLIEHISAQILAVASKQAGVFASEAVS